MRGRRPRTPTTSAPALQTTARSSPPLPFPWKSTARTRWCCATASTARCWRTCPAATPTCRCSTRRCSSPRWARCTRAWARRSLPRTTAARRPRPQSGARSRFWVFSATIRCCSALWGRRRAVGGPRPRAATAAASARLCCATRATAARAAAARRSCRPVAACSRTPRRWMKRARSGAPRARRKRSASTRWTPSAAFRSRL